MVAVFTGLGAGFERGSGAALGGMGLLGSSSLGRAGEGVFLNAATGNLLINRQDEFLVGRGPDVAIARTYNSHGALDDANNDDWRHSTDRRLMSLTGTLNTAGSTITRVGADGSEILYTYGTWADGSYYRATDGAGAHDKLTHASGVWTWEEGSSHFVEAYEAAESNVWRIKTARDGDTNTLTFTYVAGDPTKLEKITTADGSYVQYAWTGVNITKVETYYTDLVTNTSNQKLTRVYYGYDGQNRLTSVIVDLSPKDNATADGKTYELRYTYDGTSNRVASITQSDGSALSISYVNVSGVYKVSRLAQTVASGESRTTDILYSTATVGPDTFDVAEVRVYRDATLTGYVSTTLKSLAGQLREVQVAPAASGQTGQAFAYTYDTLGNVLSVSDATSERTRLTEYVYDNFGNATQITVKLNGSTTADTTATRTYVNNNLTQETVTGSNASSANASLLTRYVYDSENHLRFTISAEGRVSEFEYETTGELKRTIAYRAGFYTTAGQPDEAAMNTWGDANAAHAEVKTYEYDIRGGLLRAYGFSATTSFVESTNDGRSQVNSVYDQSGALLSRWVEGQAIETFIYDGLGRMIASTDLSGGITHLHFVDDYFTSGNGAQTVVITRAAFNSGSNDWDATADSLVTTSTFNRAGELITRSETVGPGGVAPSTGNRTYDYDKLGRLRSVTDATARKTYFLYDDLGRKTADVGQDGQLTEYRYDRAGRLVATIRYATAISTSNIANAANAVVIGDVRPAYNASDIAQWTVYDANDRVVQTIQGDGAVTAYAYDKLGRLITTSGFYNKVSVTSFWATPPASAVSVTAHAKDFIVRSFYDGDGTLIGALNGEGYLSEIIYDAAGRKIQDIGYANATNVANRASGTFSTLKTGLTNASADRNVRYVYDGQGFLRFTIDALGNVTEARYWDGPTSSPSLAARQQATGLVRETLVYNVTLGSLGSYDYATVKAAVAALTTVTPRVTRFVYNDKAQLVYTVDAAGAVTRNWYDASGRLTKTASYSTLYTTAFSTDSSAWKAALDAWTPSGDQTRITRFYYNVRNETAFVVDAEGYVTGRSYDAEGRVISESRYANKLTTVDDSWTWSSVNGASKGTARSTTSAYDNLGRLQYTIDVTGRFEYFTYYANGARNGKIEGTWADNSRTVFGYDQAGKLSYEWAATSKSAYVTTVGASASVLTTVPEAQQIRSANSQYEAMLDSNGELLIYHNGEVTWRTATAESVAGATYRLVVDASGKLVIYRDVTGQTSVAIWQSAASSAGATSFAISDNGVLSLQGGASTVTVVTAPAALNPYAATWLTTSYAYDGFGNVIQTTAPNGQVTTMAYDKANRLLSRTSVVGAQTITQSFEYNAFDSVKSIDAIGNASYSYFDKLGRLAWSADTEGYVNQTIYNGFGEAASSIRYRERATNAASLNATTLPTLAGGDTGLVTSYVYDNLGRISYVIDAENYVTGTTYNAFGQTLSVTRFANTTATLGPPTASTGDATTEFQYDLLGRVTRNEDANSVAGPPANEVAELYGYDAYDRTSVTNRAGGVTTNIYDGSGLLVQETIGFGGGVSTVNKYEYDARGNLTKKIEAWDQATGTALRTTRYEYDKVDRLIAIYHDARSVVTSADGTTSTVTPTERFYYDKNGNLAGSIDRAGARTFYWYDGIGRLTHKLAPNGAVTAYTYDLNGRVTEAKAYAAALTPPASVTATPPAPTANAALDRVTQYVYDKLGRTLEAKTLGVRAASHNSTALSVDAAAGAVSTLYDYDSVSNVVRTTNANGAKVHAHFDKLGRKIAEIDAAGYRSSWTYDANGNVTLETRYAGAGSVPTSITAAPPAAPSTDATNDRVTNFTYDKMGRRLTETRLNVKVHSTTTAGTHATQSATIAYTYNALGLIATKTEASGDAITYAYDSGGRMTSEQRSGFTDVNNASVTPKIEYAYNGLNDLTQVRAVGAGGAVSASDRITYYTYGAGGLLATKTDAAGFKRSYIYDAAGRVQREEYNRLDFSTNAAATEAIGYDYDSEGRITRQGALVKSGAVWSRDGAAIDTALFSYNAFGDLISRGFAHYTAGAQTNLVEAEKFEYDASGRLVKSNSGDGAWKYFMYDAAGNQTLVLAAQTLDFSAAAYDTLSEVLALWTGGTATIATTNVAGVVATITRYDGRNQAIEVREPQRQRNTTTFDNLVTTRAYTAFGDVAYEINAAGARVDYTYNTMGRRIKVESPAVEGVGENGLWYTGYDSNGVLQATSATAVTFRPVEHFYYDKSGRLVAQRDANANLTKYTLLAGTGYGGSQALIAETFGADGSVTRTKYDVHGDARRVEDALYVSGSPNTHVTLQNFDAMGRLIAMNRSNVLTDWYAYDGLGQRIKHWNSFHNPGWTSGATSNAESTAYDAQGRITQVIAMGGDTTAYAYAWDGSITTNGMSTTPFGGWVQITTYANTKTMVQKSDIFDHDVQKTDLGAHTSNYVYDKAGRLTQISATFVVDGATFTLGDPRNQTYFNTGRLASIYYQTGSVPAHAWSLYTTSFGYDIAGNVTAQKFVLDGERTYMTPGWWSDENGNPLPPNQQPTFGDIWHEGETVIEDTDAVLSNQTASYDSLGRIVQWNELGGTLSAVASHAFTYDAAGNIRRSLASYRTIAAQGDTAASPTTQDYWYRYDAANRMLTSKGALSAGQVVRGTTGVDSVYNLDGTKAYTLNNISGARREDYAYDALGRVTEVKSGTNQSTPGIVVGVFVYDALGRLTSQTDWASTTVVAYSRTVTYNAKGQVVQDDVSAWQGGALYRSLSDYTYGTGAGYALGAALQIATQRWKNGGAGEPDTLTLNTYAWWDGAVQMVSSFDADAAYTANTPWLSTYGYTVIGGQAQLSSVSIQDGRPRTVWFATDMLGQVIRRDEQDNLSGGDPHEIWYRFSGRQMGYAGNNGYINSDYAQTINQRAGSGGAPGATADFDLAYDPINAYEQGSRGGMYTVQAGDTLQSIASNLWGDASLWYKIAEVNGLTAESVLVEGQPLIVPVGVQTNANNASTFKPYDPLEVLGNTSPTSAAPPKAKKGCGVLGQVILFVIAAVVAFVTRDFLTAAKIIRLGMATKIVTAAIAGAAGSIASQGAAVATGYQDRISWNAVAVASISAGVIESGIAEKFTGGINNAATKIAVEGAIDEAVTQGISMATGLQKDFDWAGVAAAGVAAYAGSKVEGPNPSKRRQVMAVGARMLANAAARSLIDGSDFGDNMTAALPSAIGQSLMLFGRRGPAPMEEEEPQPASNRAPQTASDVDAMYGLHGSGPLFHGEDGGGLDWLLRHLGLAPPLGEKSVRSEPPSVAWDDGVSFEDEIVVEGLGYRPAWEYFANRPGTTYVPGSQRASPQPVERQIRGEFAEGRVRALGPSPPSHRDGFGEGLGMGMMSMLEPFYPEAYEYGHPATTPEQAQGRTDGMTAVAVLTLGLAAGGRSQPRVSRPSTAGAADDVARTSLIDEAARLAAADEALLGLGVRDAALRERMLAAGFDPAVMQGASPRTTQRFEELFQGTLDRGKQFAGVWGTLETRVATITRAMELENAGYRVAYEVRYPGSRAGTYKWADLMASRASDRRIFQFETNPNSRTALANQRYLQRVSGIPVEIVPVTRRRP